MTDHDQPDGGETSGPVSARTRLMEEVMNQMKAIEDDFGDNFEIGDVVLIVEVFAGEERERILRVRKTAAYMRALGMLHVAARILDELEEAGRVEGN